MIKIFTPEKTIYLTDDKPALEPSSGVMYIPISSPAELNLKYREVSNNHHLTDVYFINKNPELLFDYFASLFTIINAAGGLVRNNKNEWLFIFRNEKWDLPKGKIEKGETIETAAIREVEEECGISQLKIVKKLSSTFHIYSLKGKMVLNRTYWFEMICSDLSPLIPQKEEGITDVKWFNIAEAQRASENTFGSIKDILKYIN